MAAIINHSVPVVHTGVLRISVLSGLSEDFVISSISDISTIGGPLSRLRMAWRCLIMAIASLIFPEYIQTRGKEDPYTEVDLTQRKPGAQS